MEEKFRENVALQYHIVEMTNTALTQREKATTDGCLKDNVRNFQKHK